MRWLRHLPLFIIIMMMLTIAACGSDEPRHRAGEGGTSSRTDTTNTSTDTTAAGDTTSGQGGSDSDTTGTHSGDTTSTFAITITAPRNDAYMGQTLQLTASTSTAAEVKWRSANTRVANVDANGLVTMHNVVEDSTAPIIATANGVSDTIVLTNRCWLVAANQNNSWTVPTGYHKVHAGDTLVLTIVNSATQQIDDNGFNAGACQWSLSSPALDVNVLLADSIAPNQANGWRATYIISNNVAAGTAFSVMARLGKAASSLSCSVAP